MKLLEIGYHAFLRFHRGKARVRYIVTRPVQWFYQWRRHTAHAQQKEQRRHGDR